MTIPCTASHLRTQHNHLRIFKIPIYARCSTGFLTVWTIFRQHNAQIASHAPSAPSISDDLSALLFWGDSKVLKGREQWLCDLLGLPQGAIAQRILPVDVTFPSRSPVGVLMLENLDSYFSAWIGNWPACDNLIKIYTQGFRGTAARIRNPACAGCTFQINAGRCLLSSPPFEMTGLKVGHLPIPSTFAEIWIGPVYQSSDPSKNNYLILF